ncbi:MAG: B12-binding domain-containing radical SAM protein [Planctomycetes bacterium]|nr:B12-binding domain-containing radical SAM protein [Planctomycetota bacterium]
MNTDSGAGSPAQSLESGTGKNYPAVRRLFRMIIPGYPAFNIYSHIARKTTALGPLCVATSVSKMPGWDVEIIDENNYRFPGPMDDGGRPDHAALQEMRKADAVGFYGGLSCTIPRLMQVAAFYKKAGAFTVGGGHHLTALPEEALRGGLDAVVNGEGETAVRELLETRDAGGDFEKVPGITFLKEGRPLSTSPREPMEDFEPLPLPDFGLLRFARIRVFPISRIRGCGMNCEFCSVKGRARPASPERLLEQIRYLVEGQGAREFFIVDDQFAQDRKETLRFCQILREYQERMGLSLFITVQIRLDCARDTELLTAMRSCNIKCLAVGIESPIDEELRAMGKHLVAADMAELARTYHRHGFLVHGMFIFGYPMRPGVEFKMSGQERIRRYRAFFSKARMDTVQVLLPVPLPGTEFRDRLQKEGRVLPNSEIGWEYYDGNFPIIVPDEPLTPEDMHLSMQALMGGFYRFRRMFGVMLHTIRFPLAMLPLVNLRTRWRKWYRHWRNDVIGSAGYFIMKKWHKAFREGPFRDKLLRGKAILEG